ncbi:MAG: efflux RND transporter periplasmic adaptor subunit [Gammaproteobacteria bacterium]
MDRVLERKRGPGTRSIVFALLIVLTLALIYLLVTRSGESRLRIDPTRMTTAEVTLGQFREYYPSDGRVEPVKTVYLDIEEGGRVEEVFVEGGQYVEAGDLILRFSNATLQRSSIDTETRLVENLNALRNTQINLATSSLLLRDQLLDVEYRIHDLEKTSERYEAVNDLAVTREVYERALDELAYLRDKRALLIERIEREDQLAELQLAQADRSIERLNLSLELLTSVLESLDVRAPISGFLSNVNAELGQNINRGQRIGQIDILDDYKISVSIDQYYISRVEVGTRGRFDLDGATYDVVVEKLFPEVDLASNTFTVDVAFAGEVPPNLRRGQRVTVEMSFGEPEESLMVARGGFYQQTSGRWVYLISEDRKSARRVPIRLGRQNPRFVEVLEGLKPGDWIITSSYDAFNEVDELRFATPIELND